jgi:hypothetical protein
MASIVGFVDGGGRGPADEPFSWSSRADGTVIISYRDAPVVAVRGVRAAKFLARVQGTDPGAAQLLMARVTGKFKRGNERR